MTTLIVCCTVGGVVALAVLIPLIIFRHRKVKLDKADEWLVNEFRRCNVMVFGKKGSGKDVIFAHVIALRGEKHYSNIYYDENTEVIELSEIAAGDNTIEDVVRGNIRKFDPRFEEGFDIYVSDAGIWFPNFMYSELVRLYPSLNVHMALSRQLYNSNVHTNCQGFDRPLKVVREQSDSYIQVLETICRGDCLYTKIRCYDNYHNAENEVNPCAVFTVRVPLAELHYDSRYFRNVFLNRKLTPFEELQQLISGV